MPCPDIVASGKDFSASGIRLANLAKRQASFFRITNLAVGEATQIATSATPVAGKDLSFAPDQLKNYFFAGLEISGMVLSNDH